MSSTYAIPDLLPDETLDHVSPGTSVLISGPAMIGKRELAIRLLAAGHRDGDGIICVTTRDDAAKVIESLEREIPSLDRDRVGVVDCSGRDQREAIQEIATERVSSPGDLTGISIGTAKLLKHFARRDVSEVRHGLVSVSTLLQYLDLSTVFKFLHIYTSRIDETDGLGVFTLDSEAHDEQTVSTITGEFDHVVELRESETGDREIRLLGHPDSSRNWHPY